MWKGWDLNCVCLSSKYKLPPNILFKILPYDHLFCQLISLCIHFKTTAKTILKILLHIYTLLSAEYAKKQQVTKKKKTYKNLSITSKSPHSASHFYLFSILNLEKLMKQFSSISLVKKIKGLYTDSNCNSTEKISLENSVYFKFWLWATGT